MPLTSVRFDAVRDTQKVFRVLLDALSHPGKLYELPRVGFVFGSARTRSSAFDQFQALGAVLATLLDHEVTFCLLGQDDAVYELNAQIADLTSSHSADREQANYVVSLQAPTASLVSQLNSGNLLYPDTSTTLICLVSDLATSSPGQHNGTLLALEGPGVAERQMVWVADIDAAFFNALSAVNARYPLGIDIICIAASGRVVGLPRSSQLTILKG